jgi:hypothetical protein
MGDVRAQVEDAQPKAVPASMPAQPLSAVDGDRLGPTAVLAMQRTAGNRAARAAITRWAAARLLARWPMLGAPPEVKHDACAGWAQDDVRAIQRQLRRLRLYDLLLDGDRGRFTDLGLTEAFGGEEWRTLDAATVLARLEQAKRAAGDGGRTFRFAELFKDGVFDVTFGLGYKEAEVPEEEFNEKSQTAMAETAVATLLADRGFVEDGKRAVKLLADAGRAIDDPEFGRWFVKENAATYAPPAGPARTVHAVVRVVRNTARGGGGRARAAFVEGMTRGDLAFYTGHGRYGTGPDFDRNFLQFRLYQPPAKEPVQTLDDYDVLERELAKHGKPWTVFKQWVADGRLEVDFSNAGNLRLVANTPHKSEFGGALMQWALEQQQGGSAAATGAGGALAEGAEKSGRGYRLLAFAGCRTQDYEQALRGTPGYGAGAADVLETTRTVRSRSDRAGYGAFVFTAFVDSVLAQVTTQKLVKAVDKAMRENEPEYSGNPFTVTGKGGPRS